MRVGLIAQPLDGVLPPRHNSIGLILYNTAVELGRHLDVCLLFRRRPDTVEPDNLNFRCVPISAPLDDRVAGFISRYPRWADRLRIRHLADDHPFYARAVAQALDKHGCSVAHVMNYWQWCRSLRSHDRAVVLEMQSEWLSQMNPKQVRRQLEATDGVVGVSDHITRLFRRAHPEYRGRTATVYNGVDTDTFIPVAAGETATSGRRPLVLFVGRMSPEKGVHVLLQAFARVVKRNSDAVLELVGPRTELPFRFLAGLSDDPHVRGLGRFYEGESSRYQRHLDELVADLGLQGHVKFVGNLPHKELIAKYQSAAVVVNPSFSESFGISVVEAMATAVPVVATSVGGMLETVVNGETGYLVEVDQPEPLGDAVVQILDNRSLAAQMGQKGRERAVERFSWRARAARLAEVYTQVAASRPS
jgi:glycosyltransferase involved in cell wall biosynthesis